MGALNTKIMFRKKAISDFEKEALVSATHYNQGYQNAFKEDSSVFKKYTGICTNVYDAAHRFGIKEPFKV